jgi:hypothetical protein
MKYKSEISGNTKEEQAREIAKNLPTEHALKQYFGHGSIALFAQEYQTFFPDIHTLQICRAFMLPLPQVVGLLTWAQTK